MQHLLYSKEHIAQRVQALAKQIAQDYHSTPFLLLCVLRGSFIVASDLIRALYEEGVKNAPIEFIQIASYGDGQESNKHPTIISDVSVSLENKHVIVVEDIVDTGYSIAFLKKHLETKHVASIKYFTFLNKEKLREIPVQLDYIGFTLPGNGWIVGYGLDDDTTGRGKGDISEIISEEVA